MSLSPGTKLGPYEIVAPLGAGGMGEVYRARDARLGRDVAVKVLPEHLSSNSEVRARFEREARTVSSLNHPHICTLHDVGREGDTDFLVMELVEGETLAERLARGALPAADVLRLGAQIADALDRAHRAGVVHRDLKPGNVMLSRSGAKLMDFGLARAAGLGASGSGSMAMTESPTMGQPLTAEGTIVGTFQYMAPEQLEGKEADARSDLWALGCVLYEMATGKRAFEGKSQASLIGAIMNSDPAPISQFAPMSPPAFERLVRQCLTRDPDERRQSAGDVRRELEWIAGGSSQAAAPVAGSRRRKAPQGMIGLLAGIGVALAAILYSFGPGRAPRADTPLMRFSLTSPAGTNLARPAEAALSPDGALLAFVAVDSSETNHIYFRPLASPDARMVPGTEDGSLPFWSPDSRMLAFFSSGKLRKVTLDGSPPVALCDAPDARGGDWSKDGVIIFAPTNQGPIARVPATGGVPELITTLDASRQERGHRYPQFLPDGKHFLYVAVGSGEEAPTFAASIEGGAPVEVCRAGTGARWAPSGYLLYLDEGVSSLRARLLARRFDPEKLSVSGNAALVLEEVQSTNFGYANVVANLQGNLIVQHWSDPRFRVVWRDRRGDIVEVVSEDSDISDGSLSPDDSKLVYSGTSRADLFVLDLATGVSTRLTFENKTVGAPLWSFDGRTIAYQRLSMAHGWQVYKKAADGTGPDSLLFRGPGLLNYPQAWSKDGRWLVALCADTTGNFDLWRVPMEGTGAPEPYQRTAAQEGSADLSPDGQWILYLAEEVGQSALYVQSFPNPGTKYQVAFQDPAGAGWSANGNEILVGNPDGELFSVEVTTANGFRQGATTRLFKLPPTDFFLDIDEDKQQFLTSSVKDLSSLSRLEIVLGWTQLLGKEE